MQERELEDQRSGVREARGGDLQLEIVVVGRLVESDLASGPALFGELGQTDPEVRLAIGEGTLRIEEDRVVGVASAGGERILEVSIAVKNHLTDKDATGRHALP